MKASRKFWDFVGEKLAGQHNKPVSEWKKRWIETILIPKITTKVAEICEKDKEKAALVGILPGHSINMSYHTIWRVLGKSDTTRLEEGNRVTKEILAIYLEYDSYEACLEEEELYSSDELETDTGEQLDNISGSKNIMQANIFSFLNKSLAKNIIGKLKQWNFFSFGNRQEVINGDK